MPKKVNRNLQGHLCEPILRCSSVNVRAGGAFHLLLVSENNIPMWIAQRLDHPEPKPQEKSGNKQTAPKP